MGRAVEDEVRKYIADKRLGFEIALHEGATQAPLRSKAGSLGGKSYDMPRQMEQASSTTNAELVSKRQELLSWESTLLEKSRQMEEAVEQFNVKMQRMAA